MTGAKIVDLDGNSLEHEGEPDPEVVQVLETMLAHAQAGRLVAVAGGYELDGNYHCFVTGSGRNYDMVGALEFAKAHIIRVTDD